MARRSRCCTFTATGAASMISRISAARAILLMRSRRPAAPRGRVLVRQTMVSTARTMIDARTFVEAARARGFGWYAGVPCSYLTPFINYVLEDSSLRYVSMANEGDAVAFIAGVALGATAQGTCPRGFAMLTNPGPGT